MFKETPIVRCMRIAFSGGVAGLALVALPALAQDAEVQKAEKVEITGSSIKRIDAETALPVQVLTRQDIQRTGAQSTEDLLRTISAVSSAFSIPTSAGSGATTGGVSTVSLRALGGARTLVLINGRRATVFGGVAGGGGDTAVDVNSIPLAAIERVEILKDGASAIYGSDAVAGVVNFILRKDYTGGEVSATYGDTQQGGAKTKRIDGVIGFGDLQKDGYNVMVNAGYDKEDPLYGRDRAFANSGVNVGAGNDVTSGNTFPGNIITPGGASRNPLAPNCAPSISDPFFNPATCRFDPSPYVALLPDTERTNVLITGRLALNANTEAYVEGAVAHSVTKYTIQPSPLSDQFALPDNNPYVPILANLINSYGPQLQATYPNNYDGFFGHSTILIPPSSPYYPTAYAASLGIPANMPVVVRYRAFGAGLRSIKDTSDSDRFVAGIKGSAIGWDYDLGFLYNQSKVKENPLDGYFIQSQFLPLINSGIVNPFGPNTPAVDAQIKNTLFTGTAYESKTSTTGLDLKGSREIYQLATGAVSVALGGDLRKEKYSLTADPTIQSGDVSGYGGNFLPVDVNRNVSSAYAEINAPILKNLEADAAIRYDHYEGVGNTTNPKVSLRWQPDPAFLVRGSWGTGFRAPSLTDLYAPVTQGVTESGLSDPLNASCGTANPNSNQCNTQFTTVNGGNTKLKPEKSESYTFGVVFEPTRDLHVGFDFFKINLSNTIVLGGLSYDYYLSSPALARQFSQFINRDAQGNIVSVDAQNANLFDTRLNGVDVDFKYRFLNNASGKWTLALNGTYYNKYDVQNPDGTYSSTVGNGGTITTSGVLTRWKHVASLTWDYGPWSVTAAQNFQTGYLDIPSTVTGDTRQVGTYETYDAQASYTGFKGLTLIAGIKNLMDRDPPYTNVGGQGVFQAGYDPSYGDPRGRFFYGTITYKFK